METRMGEFTAVNSHHDWQDKETVKIMPANIKKIKKIVNQEPAGFFNNFLRAVPCQDIFL